MKITVVGGGSTYTPELVEGLLLEAEALDLQTVCLFDINETRLQVVGDMVKRMVNAKGNPFNVVNTTNRREAITGADFVLTQIRVGGQQARHDDTLICLEEDVIGQETTGAAGFAKAMRTIPVILDICDDIKKYAPNAWLINFTNPAGIVTEAVLKYGGVNVIGLCNVPIGIQMAVAEDYGVCHEDVDLEYVGLNHLAWVRKIFVKGEDKTEEVLAKANRAKPSNIPELTINSDFMEALGMRMNGYLNYFYLAHEMVDHLKSREKTRAQVVQEIEEALLEEYKDKNLVEKPKHLEKRGGAHYSTVAVSLIKDIHRNTGARHIVSVRNNSAIPELPEDVAVEVTAVVSGSGAVPLSIGKLEPEIRGLMQHVKAYEELTVEAAVHSDYHKALLALATNPLVPSVNKAKRLLDRFIEHHNLPLRK